MDAPTVRPEAKHLYRRLDRLFGAWKYGRPQGTLLESFLDEFFTALGDHLCLRGGALFAERRDGFERIKVVGTLPEGSESLATTAPPLALLFKHRVYIFNDPADEAAPHRFGILPPGPAAGLVVGKRPRRHAFLFALGEGWIHEELDFALNTVRAALGSRLMEERVRGSFAEAAEIQQSLLLEDPPEFEGYEFACRSVPAEEVGGDFYDFMPYDHEQVALAIGDASGHGLPAALLVRDVVTGLRMGIAKDTKIIPLFQKLNEVVHRSHLSSRFVSVFYGELESNGNLIYLNAGHQAPLLFLEGRVVSLTTGGTVIGPLPTVRFKRGFAHVDRGATLVMMTDGIIERRDRNGEFFGEDRLTQLIQRSLHLSAEDLLDVLFDTVVAWGGGTPWEDDATLVIVKRLPTRDHGAPA
jgi:sigma-B regulation protein RsbU (phosphoserine phosphatase)